MSTVSIISGFGPTANHIVNCAIVLANTNRNLDMNSLHLMLVLLDNEFLADKFSETVKFPADEFKELMRDALQNETCTEEEFKGITFNDTSREAYQVLITALTTCDSNESLPVKPLDLFDAIFETKENRVKDLLLENGIGEIETKNRSPLADMPMTSNFASDLNMLYKENKLDPVISREKLIDRMIEVLGRRTQSNPCLIGESGVGKTSLVEGLAARIESGEVPDHLKGYHVLNIDISGIVSGSKFRGEFEEKMNRMLYEAQAQKNVILFFDEMQMLMEAGGSSAESSMTASNILKPAMTKGGIKIIGATTTNEYRKFIERDGAFSRRIMPIIVDEPSETEAIKMISGIASVYEQYHNTVLTPDIIRAAVSLSKRYITDKKLPDKAISVIDETASRLKSHAVPGEVYRISVKDIRETVSNISGVDIRYLGEDDKNKLINLEGILSESVIGQAEAITSVSKAIRRNKSGINEPNRPVGSFLFVGPTGVGKTELAKNLSKHFGSGVDPIRLDMSEYMEKYSVSKLIGSAPGYVGYTDGGQLTEAVKRRPYSVILFDEIEKAHPDVFNLLLQILDEGCLTDSHGVKIDFKNTVIILTSNAGYEIDGISRTNSIGFGASDKASNDDTSKKTERAMKALESTFRPEFLNRLDRVVVFNSLGKEESKKIINLILSKLASRVAEKNIQLEWNDTLVDELLGSGFSNKYGARNLKRRVQTLVEDELADMILTGSIQEGDKVTLGYADEHLSVLTEHQLKVDICKKEETKDVETKDASSMEEQHA